MKQIFNILAITLFSFTTVFAQNQVMDFDGVNDYVDLGSSVGDGVRTIEMWFKPSSTINSSVNNFKTLVGRDNTVSNANEFNISFFPSFATPALAAGKLRFTFYDNGAIEHSVYSNSNSWNANQWYHVAAVVHPFQGMMLFIDGVSQNSINNYILAANPSNSSVNIGSWGGSPNRFFNGKIDDVRFSDTALYISNFTPSCPNLMSSSSTIGVWNFNDTSTSAITTDSSSNMNNGIIYGATSVIEDVCKIPTATNTIHFDGIDDYIDLGSTVATGTRTIEMWFKPSTSIDNTLSNFAPLIARETIAAGQADEFIISFQPSYVVNSGVLRFVVYSPTGIQNSIVSNSNRWNANQWYHVAAVIHPLQGLLLFIDGVKQNSITNYNLPLNSKNDPTTIGTQGNIPGRYFNGKIDDLRISNTALYSSNFTPSCPDLSKLPSTNGVWNFNDSSNVSITTDSSGNFNNGIIYGATGTTDDVCKIATASNAIQFDGVDDYIDLGSSVATGIRTIEMWFKPGTSIDNTLSNFAPIIARETIALSQADEFIIAFQPSFVVNSGVLKFTLYSPTGIQNSIISNSSRWNSNQWYHVAAVIHPLQGLLLFIDGVRQSSTTSYIFPPNAKSDPTTIGTQGNITGRYFNGTIDDLRFSSSALYSSNFTPTCSDLSALPSTIGVWNFNDSSNVTITTDSSGNFNNGIIYGATGVIDTICQVITSINYIDDNSRFVNVFPNPFSEKITFEFNNSNTQKLIKLYSIDGRLIIEKRASTLITVDSKKLISGLYFFQVIENEKIVVSQKIIKE